MVAILYQAGQILTVGPQISGNPYSDGWKGLSKILRAVVSTGDFNEVSKGHCRTLQVDILGRERAFPI